MKKTLLPILLCLLFVPMAAGKASAQTADEVVEKVLTALGGRDALSKITSRRSFGTIVVTNANGDIPGTVEVDAKAPNKSRTHLELDLTALGMPDKMIIDQKFDGVNGSSVNSMQGDQELTANQLQNAKNNLFPNVLLNYKAAGITVELLPKETVAGKSYLVLKSTPKEGSALKIYVDSDTYLPAKSVTKVDLPQLGEVEQTVELSDYRAVDGVKVPFRTTNSNAVQTAKFTYTKIEHNVDLPDALFRKASTPAPASR